MALPHPVFELWFSPDDTAWGFATATNIGDKVRSFECERGREHELARFNAGTSAVVLNNNQREFDPTRPDGPYAGKLLPGVRYRIETVVAGTRYYLCCNWSERWTPRWPSPALSTTKLEGVDSFKSLRGKKIVTTDYPNAILAAGVTSYYRLGDGPSGRLADLGPYLQHGAVIAGSTPANSLSSDVGAPLTEIDAALKFPKGGDGHAEFPGVVGGVGPGALTIGLWIKIGKQGSARIDWRHAYGAVPYSQWIIAPLAEGVYIGTDAVGMASNASLGDAYATFGHIDDGEWHRLIWTRSADALTHRYYTDGVQHASVVVAAGPLQIDFAALGAQPLTMPCDANGDWSADEFFTVYGREMTAAQVAADYEAAVGKWGGQQSGDRINAVLDTRGWPGVKRAIDTGITLLQPVDSPLATTPMLDHMQKVEETEFGQLFQNGDGTIVFFDRHHQLVPPYDAPRCVFGDLGNDAIEIPYDPAPEVWKGDDDITPEAIIGRVGGPPQRVIDQPSMDQYEGGTHTATDLLYASDNDAIDAASWLVRTYKDPQVRVGHIIVHAAVLPTWWAMLLSLEIGDRVTVNRRPAPKTTPAYSADFFVEWIKHTVTEEGDWWMEFALAAVGVQLDWWRMGVSLLGVNTNLGF